MTSQGSPRTRLKRALASGNALLAWATAAEMPRVDLADALALCLLVVGDRDRYARAAVRWHARFCAEARGVTLAEAQLVLSALEALPDPIAAPAAADALAHVCERRGLRRVVDALDGWGQ